MEGSHVERDHSVLFSKMGNCKMLCRFVPPPQDISDLRNPIHIGLAGRYDTLPSARVLQILATNDTPV